MAKASKPASLPAAAQAPYLKHVRLRNYRSLRDVKADFKPGINIIIGKNGAGKTNFLGLLGALLEPLRDKYEGIGCELVLGGAHELAIQFVATPVRKDGPSAMTHLLAEPQPLLVSVDANGKTARDKSLYEAVRLALADDSQWFYYAPVRINHGLPDYRMPVLDVAAELTFRRSDARFMRMTLTNSAKEWWQAGADNELVGKIFSQLFVLSFKETTHPVEALPLLRDSTLKMVSTHLDQLNDILPANSPVKQVRCSEQLQLYWNGIKHELTLSGLALEYQVENDWLPFQSLSDGTKRIVFVLSKLFAFDTITATSADLTPKIILLEEPELGIHPHQLHLLLQLIREVSKEHQVIMTTHSPQVLDMLTEKELDRITICDFDPKLGTQMRKLSAEKRKKARFYIKDDGALSEFWRFSNLEDAD